MKPVITARKRSLGQGNIFTPVCHSVHRGGGMHGCSRGGMRDCLGGHAWLLWWGGCAWLLRGGMRGCSGGMHGCSRGACMVAPGGACVVAPGGMHGCKGGHAWFYLGGHAGFIRGACVVLFGGACVVFSVFSDTMRYGQWAGGTHPTGMHSCYMNCLDTAYSTEPIEAEWHCDISNFLQPSFNWFPLIWWKNKNAFQ